MVLVCHVISQDYMIKGHVTVLARAPKVSYHPAKLSSIGNLIVEI